jgi:predicted kinase
VRGLVSLGAVPRLILLNGLPGCGKSTLARRYADEHPLALNLDIDRVRGMVGQWHDHRSTAGLLARGIALAAARAHLTAGHDVVIPQFLARPEFPAQVERLAREVGADFHEIVLLDGKENARRRFLDRNRSADPACLDLPEELGRVGNPEVWSTIYNELMANIAARPLARIVHADGGDVAKTYRAFVGALGSQPRSTA